MSKQNVKEAGAPRRSKKARTVSEGVARINAKMNTTFVTFTDLAGDVLVTMSAGKLGFKGSRRSTPYAASRVGEDSVKKVISEYGMRRCAVHMTGCGNGKESAARAISAGGMEVSYYYDSTRVAFGGPRPKKKRRV